MARSCTTCGGDGKNCFGGDCSTCFGLGDVSPKTAQIENFMTALDEHIRERVRGLVADSSESSTFNTHNTRNAVCRELAKLLLAGDATV